MGTMFWTEGFPSAAEKSSNGLSDLRSTSRKSGVQLHSVAFKPASCATSA
jgi:hypothetical protein